MLVSVKLIHLLLILVLLKGKLSNAYSQIGVNMAAGGCNAASNGEPFVDDSRSQFGSIKVMSRGRKMAYNGFLRVEKTRQIAPYEETHITSSRSTIKEQREVSSHVVKVQKSMRNILSKEKELAGFGAFMADYKGPRHHPPKNN